MADSGCQGLGHSKKCNGNGSIRAKMSQYMAYIKDTTGYGSLKKQYTEEMAKLFNKFEGNIKVTITEDMNRYVSENWEYLEIENESSSEIGVVAYVSPVQKLNERIDELEKEVEKLGKMDQSSLRISKLQRKRSKIVNK